MVTLFMKFEYLYPILPHSLLYPYTPLQKSSKQWQFGAADWPWHWRDETRRQYGGCIQPTSLGQHAFFAAGEVSPLEGLLQLIFPECLQGRWFR